MPFGQATERHFVFLAQSSCKRDGGVGYPHARHAPEALSFIRALHTIQYEMA
ncbi:hypothetical protein OKW50_000279 [Paraburkholderia youngii]|uniref:Uncharacterized protein n=1 Tax=Paraburkholderia youngii TaxID=2782701 RepID=A0A7W8L890_9BURK|nr:hypothetical protein [Paraburkholderia youngii]